LADPKGAAGQLNPAFYSKIELAPSVDDPRRLVFIAAANAPDPPDDLISLRQDYERTARVASVLFQDERPTRKELFLLIHQAADRGLRGPAFNLKDGRANLVEVRETFTDYAYKIRDQHLKAYTNLALKFGVAPLVIGVILYFTHGFWLFSSPTNGQTYHPLFVCMVAVLWIPAGAAICVWGEFALRMQSGITYDDLLTLDPSRWRPEQRLLITVGIAFIFAFLLAFDAVQVGAGSLLLNNFSKTQPAISLAVGGITGLAFAAIRDAIFRVKPTERK
jgi:hypothetical protein